MSLPRSEVARTPAQVRRLAATHDLAQLDERVVQCRACPRLVRWREEVAATKRASYRDWDYWGRPAAGFGDPEARILIVGLAPAAHGANRTGRMFTGDASGDWLFGSLHRVGLANQPTSTHRGDGLELRGTRITATVHCAPPENKPTTAERDTCQPWLLAEAAILRPHLRVVVALGAYGWDAALRMVAASGGVVPTPKPRFGHGASVDLPWGSGVVTLLGSYHPSQHNTFTGRLTREMTDEVLGRARELAQLPYL